MKNRKYLVTVDEKSERREDILWRGLYISALKTGFVLFVIITVFFSSIFALSTEDVLNKLATNMKSNDTLSATVSIEMNIQGVEKTERMKIYKKGNTKIRIENLDGADNLTVVNGNKMFIKVNGKEVVKQTGEKGENPLIKVGNPTFSINELKENYNITIKRNERGKVILHLMPKKEGELYHGMDMIIDKNKWRVSGQKMYSNTGITKMNIEYDNAGNVSKIVMDSPLPHGSDRGTITIRYSEINKGELSDTLFEIK